MAALAPKGLATAPRALFRHGLDWVLLYPYAPGTAPVSTPDLAALLHAVHLHRVPPPQPAFRAHPTLHAGLMARARAHLADTGWTARRMARLDREVAAAWGAPTVAGRLVHGDPVPGNLVAHGHNRLLIDWQCAHMGDPARDLAIAASPAMHHVYGGTQTPADLAAAYPDRRVTARLYRLQTAFHLQMIGHCLWRADRGDQAYEDACRAESAALADRLSD